MPPTDLVRVARALLALGAVWAVGGALIIAWGVMGQ